MSQQPGAPNGGAATFSPGNGMERFLESSSEAAFVIDGAQRVLAWSSRAAELMRLPVEEALGRCCYELVAGTTLEGRRVCGTGCPALSLFRGDRPFRATMLVSGAQGGARRPMLESTLVLPGPMVEGVPKVIVFLSPWDGGREGVEQAAPVARVQALGPLTLQVGGRELRWQRWPRRQAATLFKELLTQRGRLVHRRELMEVLWPEATPEQGVLRLKVLVHALRRYLEPSLGSRDPSHFVVTEGEFYQLVVGSHLDVDVDRFQRLIQEGQQALDRGQQEAALRALEEAVALYRGDYLAEGPHSGPVVEERERLRELYLSLLMQMAPLYAEAQSYAQAIATCRRALGVEPARESIHRVLMAYLYVAGQRAEALRHYRTCTTVLRRMLGVRPLPATRRLYEAMVEGTFSLEDLERLDVLSEAGRGRPRPDLGGSRRRKGGRN